MTFLISTLKGIFSGDTLFIFLAFVVLFAYGIFMGRGRIVSLILAFYPATILFNSFPFVNTLLVLNGDKLATLNKVGVFLLFLVPLSIIIERYIVSRSEYAGSSNVLRTVGLALSALILLMIFSYNTVSLDAFHDFSPNIDLLFNGLSKIFYWNAGVVLLLAIL